jgi:hypothetical protein
VGERDPNEGAVRFVLARERINRRHLNKKCSQSQVWRYNSVEIQPDARELLVLFNEKNVEYLIVGGYALAFHGTPRTSGQ